MTLPEDFVRALGERYTIEHEIGRGGMATVYLARDLRHSRSVAIKVLGPELGTAWGVARFQREIALVAQLRHPHILPLYDSGEAAGRLYYVMPYVTGGSLRTRLKHERQFPVDLAVKLTDEIASALASAHQRGIVHRDIKPENILLEGDEAFVADFGLALALAEDERLTATGIGLGTPAYMSPEQAAGERMLDARTDVYSLGCVVYEMLAGEPPFTGATQQAVMAKRLGGPAPRLDVVRERLPLPAQEAVERALARAPADRFASPTAFSEAFRRGLAADSKEPGAVRRPSRRHLAFAAILAGIVVALVAQVLSGRRGPTLPSGTPQRRIVVADFENGTRDSVLGLVSAEVMRMQLVRWPTISLLSLSDIREVLRRMGRDDASSLDVGAAREIAIREGLAAVVTGKVLQVGKAYVLSAEAIRADSGTVVAKAGAEARDSTRLLEALGALSRDLGMGLSASNAREGAPLAHVTTDSLSALRKYTLGTRELELRGNLPAAITLFQEAVAIDPRFANAWGRLSAALNTQHVSGPRAADAARRAYDLRGGLPERERYLAEARYNSLITGDVGREIAAYRAILATNPDDRYALHNLGDLYKVYRNYDAAEPLLRRAGAHEPPFAVTLLSLINVQVYRGEFAAADSTYERMVRQGMPALVVSSIGTALRASRGDWAGAESLAVRAARSLAAEPEARAELGLFRATLAATRGRLAEAHRLREDIAASEEVGVDPGTRLGAVIDDITAEAGLGHARARLLRRLDVLLADPLYRQMDPLERPNLALAGLAARLGRPADAESLLAHDAREAMPERPPFDRRLAESDRGVVKGYLDLGRGRPDLAVAEFRRANSLSVSPLTALPELGRAYEELGEADSALAVYLRYVATPALFRTYSDAEDLASLYQRIAQLYERQGERERAAEYYHRFIELYRKCDPELRPSVDRARQKLTLLEPAPN